MKKEELIRKHILGLLSETEEMDFQRMLKEENSLVEELDFQKNLVEVVMEDERLRLKDKLSKIKLDSNQNRPASKRKKYGLWIIIVVLIIVTAAFMQYQRQLHANKPEVIFAAYFETYPNTWQPVTRNAENDLLGQAFLAYENEEYDLAITRP